MLAVALLVIAVPKLLGARAAAARSTTRCARRAADVARLNATAPGQLTAPGALEGRLDRRRAVRAGGRPRGRIVARSSALGGRVLPPATRSTRALRDRQPGFADGALGPEPLRRLRRAARRARAAARRAGGAVIVAGTTGRHRAHARPHAPARRARARWSPPRSPPRWRRCSTRRALRPLTPAVLRRAGDRALRRRRPSGCPAPADARRGRRARRHAERDARLARARARGRAPLRRRRLARAAHAAHRAARQRRLRRRATAPTRPCWPTSRPTPSGSRELLDDLLALAREDAAAPLRGEPVDLAELAATRAPTRSSSSAEAIVRGERAALERARRQPRPQRAQARPRAAVTITVGGDDGEAVHPRRGRGPGPAPTRPSTPSSASGAARRAAARAPASAWRSCARSPSATAAASTSTASRFTLDCPRSCQGLVKDARTN